MSNYVHNNQRRYAISRVPQSEYSIATSPNSSAPYNFQQIILKDTPGQNFANYSVRVQNNQGYSTGSDFATEQWLTAHDVDRQGMDFDLSSENIGRLLYYAMGVDAINSPESEIYTHSFLLKDPSTATRQLPVFSYLEQIGTEHNVLYPSCVIDTLTISGDSLNRVMGSCAFKGSGKRTSPSGVNFSTQVGLAQSLNYFYNTQVAISFEDVNEVLDPLNYQCDYDNFSLTIRNELNPDSGYRAGCGKYQVDNDGTSGVVRSEMLFGQRDIDLSFTVRMNQSSKEYAYLQKQKLLSGTITLTGPTISDSYKHRLIFSFDQAAMEAVVIGAEADNIVTLQVSLKPLASLANPNRAIEIALTNTIASYAS
jgi:hypothetical protein